MTPGTVHSRKTIKGTPCSLLAFWIALK